MIQMRECSFRRTVVIEDKVKLADREDGYFHQWGLDHADFGNGSQTFSIAIVEDKNRRAHLVAPETIQFNREIT